MVDEIGEASLAILMENIQKSGMVKQVRKNAIYDINEYIFLKTLRLSRYAEKIFLAIHLSIQTPNPNFTGTSVDLIGQPKSGILIENT